MRELSLHILDLIENSVRAQATIIAVTVAADPQRDKLRIVIEDNGTGLKVTPEQALDPFYTTKSGKRTGLGLSLFRAAAERAGGRLTLGRSALGGVTVAVEMGLTHIDRSPLGDLASTFSSVVWMNPEIEFRFSLYLGSTQRFICIHDVHHEGGAARRDGALAVARDVLDAVNAELQASGILT